MTLAEIADIVCTTVRLKDADSLAACKKYIQRRHEMIWNLGLWKDTLYQLDFTVEIAFQPPPATPNSYNYATRGIWCLPDMVDDLLAVRATDRSLTPADEMMFYRVDLDEYEETGVPVKFIPLPRVVGRAYGQDATCIWGFYVENAADVGTRVVIDGLDLAFQPHTEELVLSTFASSPSWGNTRQLDRITKPVTVGDVVISMGEFAPTFRIKPNERCYSPRFRIRLVPTPTETTTYKALVKRKIIALDRDNDEPAISNMENVLIPFAEADMYFYDRKGGAAQAKLQEATAMLEGLKKVALIQSAGLRRLMPEPDGYHGDGLGKEHW